MKDRNSLVSEFWITVKSYIEFRDMLKSSTDQIDSIFREGLNNIDSIFRELEKELICVNVYMFKLVKRGPGKGILLKDISTENIFLKYRDAMGQIAIFHEQKWLQGLKKSKLEGYYNRINSLKEKGYKAYADLQDSYKKCHVIYDTIIKELKDEVLANSVVKEINRNLIDIRKSA